MNTKPISSTQHFEQHFIQQLTQLLDYDELGVFILVLANATMDGEIFSNLKSLLEKRFASFVQQVDQSGHFPVDDLSVFRQLQMLDIHNIELSQQCSRGPWTLQYNQLRSFRPARNSQRIIDHLYQPFDASAFHFNKPFLAREILYQGDIQSLPVTLFYNKYPFADYHVLLLIDAAKEKPQYLTAQDCHEIEVVIKALSHLQGLAIAYNSLGALASVNHQHWQMMLTQQPYPIEHARWNHNGGDADYPLTVDCFDSLQQAWQEIDHLQNSNQAFNLFMRPHKVYLIKRKTQGKYPHASWSTGFAWCEISGHFTLTRLSDYETLQSEQIELQLSQLRP